MNKSASGGKVSHLESWLQMRFALVPRVKSHPPLYLKGESGNLGLMGGALFFWVPDPSSRRLFTLRWMVLGPHLDMIAPILHEEVVES